MKRLQEATVASALQIMASMGVSAASQFRPHMLHRRIDPYTEHSYAEFYEWLEPGQLLAEPPDTWAADWHATDPDRFTV